MRQSAGSPAPPRTTNNDDAVAIQYIGLPHGFLTVGFSGHSAGPIHIIQACSERHSLATRRHIHRVCIAGKTKHLCSYIDCVA